jgi:hypothetical protein
VGYLAIGTSTAPSYPLDVVGTIQSTGLKIPTGAGVNKVLTSDASGVASWQTASGVPSGIITMWSGTLATIPSGWHLCDGTSGTPDLRDKFIYGTSAGQNPGATGGSTSHSHTITNREVFIGPMTGNSCEMVAEGTKLRIGVRYGGTSTYNRLEWQDYGDICPSMGCEYQYEYYVTGTGWQGCVGLKVLNLDSDAVATSVTALPPYYKLAFIMKL